MGVAEMTDKIAIITAASAGIGAACARELRARGYQVSLLARSDAVVELASELGGVATVGSVAEPEALERLVRNTLDTFGRIDAVVNNTGHPAKGELLAITDEDWHQGLELLLLPVVRMARLVTQVFERQGGGAMVNISSFAALEPSLPRPVSSALRAALSSFTRMYAERYGAQNIRMNSVLPGWVSTYEVAASDLASIPMGRPAEPHEIARVVAFLVSSEASYITGENVRVDGGLVRSL
jgi:NAD(P)-dependent dehydrogenase (short-subunit alcohol dehydrogenase family)